LFYFDSAAAEDLDKTYQTSIKENAFDAARHAQKQWGDIKKSLESIITHPAIAGLVFGLTF